MDGLAVLCEYDGAGTILTEYVPGVSMRKNNQTYYYIYDRLGSVRYVLDETGAIVNSYIYTPFGQVHSSSGSLSQPYQYIGGEFYYTEDTTGLQLLGQRWYDSETGRFISRDPIGEEGGLNLYVYVGNNVVNEVDPEGEVNPYLVARAIACAVCVGLIYKDAKDKWDKYKQFFIDCPQKPILKERIKCYVRGIKNLLQDQSLSCVDGEKLIKDSACAFCIGGGIIKNTNNSKALFNASGNTPTTLTKGRIIKWKRRK